MPGSKRREPGGKTAAAPSMSIVEKLQILRSLNCGFSESDLSNCLRQSGYRVDVAAEKLVTGQYRPLKKLNNFNHAQERRPMPTAKSTKRAASFSNNSSATPKQAPPPRQQHSLSTPSVSGGKGSHYNTVHSGTSYNQTPSASKNQKNISTRALESSSSILVTPKSTTPAAKSTKCGRSNIGTETNDWLLCQRWVGDGLNLQRGGACDYQEEFHVLVEQSSSPTASNVQKGLRFRSTSRRMDGSFPRHLSFLGPLLRNRLIKVKATALMEERRLPIGAQVAFSLSVWIIDLGGFFDTFKDGKSNSAHSYSKQFFATIAAKASANTSKGKPHESCRDAAFSMLQWAQHGKLPSLPVEDAKDDGDEKPSDGVTESNSDVSEDDIDTEASAVRISAEDEEAAIPDWARDLHCSNDGDSKREAVSNQIELEMDTPLGFRRGIQLRPYQKQALYWMTQREKIFGSGKNELIQLLKELASESAHSAPLASNDDSDVCIVGSRKEISCDCGPVVVDTKSVDASSVSKRITANASDSENLFAEDKELDHPLWERRFLCNDDRTEALSFYVQPTFRNAAAEPPPPPLPCRGGILADSMGLGKTVQLLALVQSDVNSSKSEGSSSDATKGDDCNNNSTLVVAPLSLLYQWQEEIQNKTNLSYRVHYGGDSKNSSSNHIFHRVNVVLTTYGTLQAELRAQRDAENGKHLSVKKANAVSLLSQSWKRVILDECHTIKNHSTMVAKACCLLRAERRWAVSGTIIQNSLEDVYSLMRFLHHEPFSEYAFWSKAVTKVPDFSLALNRVKSILSPIMIRRTKESRDKNGELILRLPDIDTKSVVVQFSSEERQFYEALYRKSFDIFEGLVRAGTASSSWLKIFSLLHRLRQTCSHVALTVKSHLDDGEWTSNITQSSLETADASPKKAVDEKEDDSIDQTFLEDLLQKFKTMQNCKSEATSSEEEKSRGDETKDEYALSVANMLNEAVQNGSTELNQECPICFEDMSTNDSAITPCLHIFCKDCVKGLVKNNSEINCPICSKDVDSRRVLQIKHSSNGKIQTCFLHQEVHGSEKKRQAISADDGDARRTLQTAMKGTSSSKLAAILEELRLLWKKEPGSKVLIFSQFLGFLDIIQKSFEANGIPYGRLDGKLSLNRRMEVLRDFGSASQPSASNTGSVLLISMKAGGVGLNLVAARSVFIVDPWWNAAVEDQCIDRIHRIGQTAKKIYVRKFYVADSIEQRIIELQKRKKGVARAAMCDDGATNGDGIGARPSIDDFKILFRA